MVFHTFHAGGDWIILRVNFGWNDVNGDELLFKESQIRTSSACH